MAGSRTFCREDLHCNSHGHMMASMWWWDPFHDSHVWHSAHTSSLYLRSFTKSSDSPMFLELIRNGVSVLTQISKVCVLNGNATPLPTPCVGLQTCREEESVTLWCPLKKKVSTSNERRKYKIKHHNSLPKILKRWWVEETRAKRLHGIQSKAPRQKSQSMPVSRCCARSA